MPRIGKQIALIISFIILIGSVGCTPKVQSRMKPGEDITMFVATDIHYLAESINDHGEAFEAFAASGDGKQLNYVDGIVEAFAYDISKKKPEILIISGDLTTNGEKESHVALAEKLKRIEEAGTEVYVIPGNHDIQNPWARGFKGRKQYLAQTIEKDDFDQIYRSYGYEEAISRDKASLSYLAAPTEDLWLLMLDTNQYEHNKALGMPMTNGQIRKETFAWIKQCTELAKAKQARIVTVLHHNLLQHSELLSKGYTLDNSMEAIETFEKLELSLFLSGHIHVQDIKSHKSGTGDIYDIATSSLSIYPQQYGVLRYSPKSGFDYSTARVDVEAWAKEKGRQDRNLLDFEVYSKEYFAKASYDKVYQGLQKIDTYTDEERKQMAETMSLLNSNYFGGTVNSVKEDVAQSEGYRLWTTAEIPFLREYVLGMFSKEPVNHTKLTIPIE